MTYDPKHRYLVFAGDDYYAAGGWDDLIGTYATKEECETAIRTELGKDPDGSGRWAQVVDRDTGLSAAARRFAKRTYIYEDEVAFDLRAFLNVPADTDLSAADIRRAPLKLD